MSLFRREVQAAQATQWLGAVRLQRPLSFSLITLVAVLLALALLAFGVWGEVNRKVRLRGLLMPTMGTMNIITPQAGTIVQLRVAEAQHVQAGEVLMVLQSMRNSLHDGRAEDIAARTAQHIADRKHTLRTERNLRELQSRQREQVLSDRILALQAGARQQAEECVLLQHRVELAHTTLQRHTHLADDGFVSAAQVQSRQEELLDARTRLQSAQRTQLGLQSDLRTLEGERRSLPAQLKTDLSLIERNLASLEQELSDNNARETAVITAPFDGKVSALGLQIGHAVQTGQSLLTLVAESGTPDQENALQAHLYAPSHTTGFVHPGQAVYLRYGAYPYQKFGLYAGEVVGVSSTPFAPNELPPNLAQQVLSQAGTTEALYRISVALQDQSVQAYGRRIALRPGLTLDADVLQERRKVWEWLLEPILAARQQLKLLSAQPDGQTSP